MAVLEAASYGLPAVLSDIPAHRELAISGVHYFAVGDILALEKELRTFFRAPSLRQISTDDRLRVLARHDWDDIAHRTLDVYFAASSP